MLRFREFRKTETVEPEDVIKNAKATEIQSQINQLVDGWVKELKAQLVSPTTPQPLQRGMWDRFKNSLSNLWHGRYNQSNPYFWQNKLGDDLGTTESFNPNDLSLADYKTLREVCDSLEAAINEDAGTGGLRIMRIIDAKANELKTKLGAILGQTAEVPPVTAEPTAPAAPEANSKPDDNIDMIAGMLKYNFENGTYEIDEEEYHQLMTELGSPKESVRLKAANRVQELFKAARATKGSGPTPPKSPTPADAATPDPVTPAPTAPTPADSSLKGKHMMPIDSKPGMGKDWKDLEDHEQRAWNILGGGFQGETAEDKRPRFRGCLALHGLRTLPWILRLGDPRVKILHGQRQGKLSGEGCSNKVSKWLNHIEEMGRIETPDNLIASWDDLEKRVAAIRNKVRAERTTDPSEIDALEDEEKKKAAAGTNPVAPSGGSGPSSLAAPPEELTPPPTGKKPVGKTPTLAGSLASDKPEDLTPPPNVKPDLGSGVSDPMHSGGEEDEENPPVPTPKGAKEDLRPALRSRIEALEDEDTKNDFLRRLGTAKNRERPLAALEKDVFRQEKMQLTEKAWALKDKNVEEDSIKLLIKEIEDAKSSEDLEKVKQHMKTAAEPDVFDWTVNDVKEFYKKKLRERKEEPKRANHSKAQTLPFSERVNYYRELLAQS